ncbi:MAG TPA: TPM domain-containing protein [Casimicrobiaceae bacterium]|nr:TPM domain-containing protein [Casimicrobiaceae bacterium]
MGPSPRLATGSADIRRPAEPGRLVVLALVLLALSSLASAVTWDPQSDGQQPIPALSAHVTDLTNTLSAQERQALEAKLADWEAKTTNQLAVLIVPTTKPETIEEYSIRVADAWKIGQKGKDNGAIFLIAKNDKQMRIEVGYGLEGELTDVASRRIIGDTVAPLFSKGQFAAGIDAGVDRIIAVVGGTETVAPAPPRRARQAPGFDFGTLALIALVVVPAIGAILRSIFGNVGGSLAGGAIVGGVAWLIAGSILIGVVAAIVGLIVISFASFGGRGGPGVFFPGGGGGFGGGGFGGGGGGFSGGGGGFGGGGASGGWQ